MVAACSDAAATTGSSNTRPQAVPAVMPAGKQANSGLLNACHPQAHLAARNRAVAALRAGAPATWHQRQVPAPR